MLKIKVATTATGEHFDSVRNLSVFFLQVVECIAAAVARIYIDHKESRFSSCYDSDIGVWPSPPPVANHMFISRRCLGPSDLWMFPGAVTCRCAACACTV